MDSMTTVGARKARWGLARTLGLTVMASIAAATAMAAPSGSAAPGGMLVRWEEPAKPPAEAVPKLESAKLQLQQAAQARSVLRNASADERKSARSNAVRAYLAVRSYFPASTLECAEATFRAAELLRANGDGAAALREFQWVRDSGGESPFRVRALLEIGHIERRGKRFQPALSAYEGVLSSSAATARQKDDASLWLGTVYVQLERVEDARRVWQRVAETAEDPLDRVRAYDELACSAVERGDLEAAAGILERCRDALASVSAEETKLGERMRTALSGMRAHDELQRAVADRERAKERKKESSSDG